MRTSTVQRLALVCCAGIGVALGQQPDVAQLKSKLQQLEQMMQELHKQIASLEQAQSGTQTPAAPIARTIEHAVTTPTLPTEHIGMTTRMREVANQNPDGAPRIANESIDPALRGFFRLPGTGTMIKLGGFVKTDVFVDLNQAGTYYGGLVPSSFPSSPQPKSMDSTVSMRPSRFFTEFRQPVGRGDGSVKAYLEYDFLGNYERTSLRMRQFYAQYKNVLAGQTWSAFSDPDAFPDTLEFEGPPGMIAMRSPQIRYTQPFSKTTSVGFSVEKSGTDVPFSTQYGTPVGSSTRPDFGCLSSL